MKLIIAPIAAATLLAVSGCGEVVDGGDYSAGNSALEGSCLARVVDATNTGGLSIIRTEESEANTVTYVRVPGAQAPWACYSSNGSIYQVEYTGSEGFL